MSTDFSGEPAKLFSDYSARLQKVLAVTNWGGLSRLAKEVHKCWQNKNQVFICGNGGSAGNSIHLANDLLYGVARETGGGLRVHSLAANTSVLTCLANDVSYGSIYAEQLAVHAEHGDLLIALSGSGNSENIIKVIEQAKKINVTSCAIVGFSGGRSKDLADLVIHFPVNDMQISEDLQLIAGHMLMQWLFLNRPNQI